MSPPLVAAPPPPTIIVRPIGATANRMIQHMVAMSIASRVPGARISRIHLPEWGIDEQDLPDVPPPAYEIGGMQVDVEGVAASLREGRAQSVAITGYVQNIGNLLRPEDYRGMFSADIDVEAHGEDELLISIRAAEILSGDYGPYVLIPVAFYRHIVEQTGLRPVFFGQLSECPYLDELRAAFPDARFRHGAGIIHDWEVIRRSKNICMSVSTFSWTACWLSDAHRIFMPLTGLLSPVFGAAFAGGHNLVPTRDPRFLFYNFPINLAVPQDRYRALHERLATRWRTVSGAWIEHMMAARERLERSEDDYLAIFDEAEYFNCNKDLTIARDRGLLSDARSHYVAHGFGERRPPCHVDAYYANAYPDAAEAVAAGEFIDLHHFHAARGRHLGYRTSGF